MSFTESNWQPMGPVNRRARLGSSLTREQRAEIAEQHPDFSDHEIDVFLWEDCSLPVPCCSDDE